MNAQNPGGVQEPNTPQQPPSGQPSGAPQGDPAQGQGNPAQQGQSPYGAPDPQGYPAPNGQAPQGYPQQSAPGQPGQGQPAHGYPAQGQSNGYPSATPAPKPVGPNPLAGIPITDYVMDGVAALLLLISLGLPWNLENRATGRIEVILLLVLSLLSLSVHYLARFGVFPKTWPPRMIAMLRGALNLPFVVLVLVYVVLDVLAAFDIGSGYGGLGGAAALGLAGALLAATPRQAQLSEDPCPLQPKVWPNVFFGLAGLAIVLEVVALIALAVGGGFTSDFKTALYLVVSILVVAVLVGWAPFGVFRRDHSWRLVTATLGITTVFAFLFLWSEEYRYFGNDAQFTSGLGLAYVFLPALGALALTPIIKNHMKPKPAAQAWTGAARNGAEYFVIVAGGVVLVTIFAFIAGGFSGAGLTVLILSLIVAVAGLLARVVLTNDVSSGRNQALVLAGLATLFAFVILIVTASSDNLQVSLPVLLLAFGLPTLVFIGLTAPKSVREHFAANPPAALAMPTQQSAHAGGPQGPDAAPQQAWQNQQQPHQPQQAAPGQQPWDAQQGQPQAAPAQQPWETQQAQHASQDQSAAESAPHQYEPQAEQAQPAPAQPAPTQQSPNQATPAHGFTPQQAADPSTDLSLLGQIVQEAPELRAAVASNPSTYPDLLNWLSSLNDPEVNAALAARQA